MKTSLLLVVAVALPLCAGASEVTYVTDSSQKLEQFIGDTDLQTGQPTLSLTRQWGLNNTDLGVSFYHQGMTYMVFGDSNFPGASDAIAFTSGTNPEAGLKLSFPLDRNSHFIPITFPPDPPVSTSLYDVPIFGLSSNGKMYLYFSTDGNTSGPTMGRTILSTSTDDGSSFSSPLYTLSSSLFINVSIIKVNCADWPGLPQSSGMGLLIFGSGPYRHSDIYLAFQPESGIEDKATIRFMAGLDANNNPTWSTVESDSAVIVNANLVGELSATYNVFLRKWLLFYNINTLNGDQIRFSPADQPWGPYAAHGISFDPTADHAYNNYMYLEGGTNDSLCDPNVVGHNLTGNGSAYGPYIFTNFTLGSASETSTTTTMYHSMSTWKPYNSVLMRTQLARHIAPVIYTGSRTTASVTTAAIGGADANVQAGTSANTNFGTNMNLPIKADAPAVSNFTRKAWLRFPLNLPATQRVTSATLNLITASTGSSSIPFTYQVYGLRPGNAGVNWSETGITWNNAPANDTTEISGTDPLQAVFLGAFTTPATRTVGLQSQFSSLVMRDFLNEFPGAPVTLIINRMTQDSGVESFASNQHATLAPPTLTYTAVPKFADQTITKNTSTGPLPFNVDSTVTASANLTVSKSSSNQALVGVSGIAVSGTGTARTVTLTPNAGQTGSATILLTTNDGTSTDTASFTLNVLSLVDTWRLANFGTASNTGQAADTADPDGDDVPNLVEYFLNLNPLVANSAGALPVIATSGPSMTYTYTRLKAALSEISYAVEWSDDLATWSAAGVTEQILGDDGTLQQVQAAIPTNGSPRQFVRLRLTH